MTPPQSTALQLVTLSTRALPAHVPAHLASKQERASKQLPGAGQHFSFGALKPWEDVLQYLDGKKSE